MYLSMYILNVDFNPLKFHYNVFVGITQQTLLTYPPGVAILLCDVIDKCRESPPTNWPKSTYELIMREDLASQTLNTCYNDNNKKIDVSNMDKSNNWNDVGETDIDIIKDGMGNMDDEVKIIY